MDLSHAKCPQCGSWISLYRPLCETPSDFRRDVRQFRCRQCGTTISVKNYLLETPIRAKVAQFGKE